MNQQFVIDQLRDGDKTVKEIAEIYCQQNPRYTVYNAMLKTQQKLQALRKYGIVEVIDTVRVSVESYNIINGRSHNTQVMNVWRLMI